MWEAANRSTRKGDVDCMSFLYYRGIQLIWAAVHILALLHHPSKPVSTIIIEQYRPPAGKTVVGELPLFLWRRRRC